MSSISIVHNVKITRWIWWNIPLIDDSTPGALSEKNPDSTLRQLCYVKGRFGIKKFWCLQNLQIKELCATGFVRSRLSKPRFIPNLTFCDVCRCLSLRIHVNVPTPLLIDRHRLNYPQQEIWRTCVRIKKLNEHIDVLKGTGEQWCALKQIVTQKGENEINLISPQKLISNHV